MSRTFEPTEEQRKTVKVMSGFGVPQPDIATFLGIDSKTLRKHFREDLDRGMIEANVKVAQTLFNMATVDKNVAAAIFWMKARAGWREKHDVQISADPYASMSDAELHAALKQQLAQCGYGLTVIGKAEPGQDLLDLPPEPEPDNG